MEKTKLQDESDEGLPGAMVGDGMRVFDGRWNCYISWLGWGLHYATCLSKFIELYIYKG